MTVRDMSDALNLKLLAGEAGLEKVVERCYIGDLLSWVMGRAPEKSVWITVMGNVNAVAVAQLADISCIVLCESAHLDEEAKAQAAIHQIPVLGGEDPAYALAMKVAALLGDVVLTQ